MSERKVYPIGFIPDSKSALGEKSSGLREIFGEEFAIRFATEEEIAVILAKVSRNPGGFLEIAATVDEEGAAQFHGRWVVSVEGYGHASVAEHAITHIAIENVSSLLGDEITDNRLASPTEFSARFKGRQEMGYFTPDSVSSNPKLAEKWHATHKKLFAVHDRLMEMGSKYIETDEAKTKVPGRKVKIKAVADQFKNIMPASRLTSIGITMNAREAEHAIMKFLSSKHQEVNEFGEEFKTQCLRIAPTLVKYADRNMYLVEVTENISEAVKRLDLDEDKYPEIDEQKEKIIMFRYNPDAVEDFIAAALYSEASGNTLQELSGLVKRLSDHEKQLLLDNLLGGLDKHDIPLRALEFAGSFLVEVPAMTYGDWREWKRHRMETYDAKELSVNYGYMIPPLAREMDESEDSQFHGCVDTIDNIMAEVKDLYEAVATIDPLAAEYCVTRLHYRPAIVEMNLREAFQLISLRTGPTAHPFIRRLAWALYDEVTKAHPLFKKYLDKRLYAEDRPSRNFQWTF